MVQGFLKDSIRDYACPRYMEGAVSWCNFPFELKMSTLPCSLNQTHHPHSHATVAQSNWVRVKPRAPQKAWRHSVLQLLGALAVFEVTAPPGAACLGIGQSVGILNNSRKGSRRVHLSSQGRTHSCLGTVPPLPLLNAASPTPQ